MLHRVDRFWMIIQAPYSGSDPVLVLPHPEYGPLRSSKTSELPAVTEYNIPEDLNHVLSTKYVGLKARQHRQLRTYIYVTFTKGQ